MFYVYELRDENEKVFYVGKGSGRRIYEHRYKAKHGSMTHRACKIRKIWEKGKDFTAVKVFFTGDEKDAHQEERRLIALYGRENLTNKTDGGDGTSNPTREAREKISACRRGYTASPETREKQRLAKLGTHRTEETKRKISNYQKGTKKPWARVIALKNLASGKMDATGRKQSDKTKAKFRRSRIGHIVTQETRDKISQSKKGSIPWNKGKKTII